MAGFLQENDGAFSSTRLMFLAVTLTVLGTFVYSTVSGKPIPIIPESVLVLFGIGTGGKVVQKALGENGRNTKGTSTSEQS